MVIRTYWKDRQGPLVFFLALSLVPWVVTQGSAQEPGRDRLLVSSSWLMEHLGDEELVLLHVGGGDSYGSAHIPGARPLDVHDISPDREDMALELPDDDHLREVLERLGISDDSRVVVYVDGNGITAATRVLFTLDHAGLGERTSLLDGGLAQWRAAGGAVTDQSSPSKVGRILARPAHDRVVDSDWVIERGQSPGVALVDARAAAFYDGIQASHGVTGHIPGALGIPYNEMVDESLRLRSAEELRSIFREAGVEEGDTVVTYCHIGQQATLVLFAARTLGFDVRLYDGSWNDWVARGLEVDASRDPR